jgi:hypothetical protein
MILLYCAFSLILLFPSPTLIPHPYIPPFSLSFFDVPSPLPLSTVYSMTFFFVPSLSSMLSSPSCHFAFSRSSNHLYLLSPLSSSSFFLPIASINCPLTHLSSFSSLYPFFFCFPPRSPHAPLPVQLVFGPPSFFHAPPGPLDQKYK